MKSLIARGLFAIALVSYQLAMRLAGTPAWVLVPRKPAAVLLLVGKPNGRLN